MKNNIDISALEFNISEIFYSVQGESTRAGLPCVFVRLQGCELRCWWCDTQYAQDINFIAQLMTGKEIINQIRKFNCNFITFTGGEPLLQKDILQLMTFFADEEYTVALETHISQDMMGVDNRVIKIVDFKCPSSKMEKFNNFDNIKYLQRHDEVKFVIADRNDYEWAKEIIQRYSLEKQVDAILLSPAFGLIEPEVLARWMLENNLKARLQLQIHKYIWEPDLRGV